MHWGLLSSSAYCIGRSRRVAPDVIGIVPVLVTAALLVSAGLRLSEMDLIELNKAFPAKALVVCGWRFTDADRRRSNVRGSGISVDHPIGATGGRMPASLARELLRRDARYGLETTYIGGSQGLAATFERVLP